MEVAKLLSFTVANYRPFYTPQTFDFTDNDGQPRTLTVILGPNSSGKSNCDFAIRDIAIGETKLCEETLSSFPLPVEAKQALVANGGTTFSTLHAIRDDELSIVGMGAMGFWTQESNGTRKFFEMAVPIVSALDNGYTLYLDEYGTYLHPNLAKALVSLFKSDENKTGAHLILNAQGTPLMGDVTERDDIVFVEKDMAEESRVTPLKDRGACTTEPLESRYLRGLYGAVPRVRDR